MIAHHLARTGVTLLLDTAPIVVRLAPSVCPLLRLRAGSVWPVYLTGAGELERARWSLIPLRCRTSDA